MAPGEAILAPRDNPGGSWEQQDGHEVANDKFFVDFGMISGLVQVSFWGSKCVKHHVLFMCISMSFFSISDSHFRRLTSKSLFSHWMYCKILLFMEILFKEFRNPFLVFWGFLVSVFLIF